MRKACPHKLPENRVEAGTSNQNRSQSGNRSDVASIPKSVAAGRIAGLLSSERVNVKAAGVVGREWIGATAAMVACAKCKRRQVKLCTEDAGQNQLTNFEI